MIEFKYYCSGYYPPRVTFCAGNACIDLCYNGELEAIEVGLDSVCVIPTKTFVEIPDGYAGIILERSGLALKGIQILGRVIDPNYRGEIKVILKQVAASIIDFSVKRDHYYSEPITPIVINPGNRIAQMIIVPFISNFLELCSLDEFSKTERGSKGLGSSGI
jgi:dUTP pyrophosphatase